MRKVLSILAVALLLIYIGYQVTSNLTETIKTVDAVVVEVEDKVTCRGVFVRSAAPVTAAGGDYVEYLVENGEKVASGQQVAASFPTADAAESYRTARSLERDVRNAELAYQTITGDDGGLTLDLSIYAGMTALSARLDQGRVWEADPLYSGLTQDVVAREYPREELEGLQSSIEEMRASLAEAQAGASAGAGIFSGASGYFLRAGDGSPSLCAPDELNDLTCARLEELLEAEEPAPEDGVVGYIVDSFDWYFAFCTDPVEAAALEKRGTVQLYFPNMIVERVTARVRSVSYEEEQAVVVLSCGYINDSFLSALTDTADIVKRTYTGIRVPKEALRMNDGQWGVYCLSGASVRFKPIQWSYQGDGYYIVPPADSSAKGLYLYDKIIVRGKNLSRITTVS